MLSLSALASAACASTHKTTQTPEMAMSVWFEGSNEIACDIQHVERAVEDKGELFIGVVRHMPNMADAVLVEQGDDSVIIRTNEGLMTRSNISTKVGPQAVVIEYDEVYEAGKMVTAKAHFMDEFTASGSGVLHHMVISDVEAPGFLGFFYRKFGNSSTGNAFLSAYAGHLEGRVVPPS